MSFPRRGQAEPSISRFCSSATRKNFLHSTRRVLHRLYFPATGTHLPPATGTEEGGNEKRQAPVPLLNDREMFFDFSSFSLSLSLSPSLLSLFPLFHIPYL